MATSTLNELLVKNFGEVNDGDEDSLAYVQSVLDALKEEDRAISLDEIKDILPLIEAAIGVALENEVGDDEIERFCKDIATSCGMVLEGDVVESHHLKKLEKPLTLAETPTLAEDVPEAPKATISTVTSSSPKKGKMRRKTAKAAKSRAKKNDLVSKEPKNTNQETSKDKEWSTKRMERFHKNWAGNETWKVQDHALSLTTEELDDDDYSSAWLECLRKGIPWGGRGAGGRGVQRVTGETKDIKIANVSMSRGPNILLEDATMLLAKGKKYGLVGKNGVGKTTLLRRIARGALPGFPPWVRVQYVEQELQGSEDKPLDYVLKYDFERTRLLLEEEEITNDDNADLEGKRLSEIYERLEQIDAFSAPDRAEAALRSLGFDDGKLEIPTNNLSGGWRIRVALAGAIFMDPDLLLMDEPTNHLDVLASEWLKQYLSIKYKGTMLFVSHDQSFLDVVSTDIIEFRDQQLYYFAGNYSEYKKFLLEQRKHVQKDAAATKKKADTMMKFVEKQRRDANKKGSDQKKQAQIRSKEKRIHKMKFGDQCNYKKKGAEVDSILNGPKAYHLQAGGKIKKVVAYDPGKPVTFKFHDCNEPPNQVLIRLTDAAGGYEPTCPLFTNLNIEVTTSSKIAIIGANGIGKSTLLKCMLQKLPLISGEIQNKTRSYAYFAQTMIEEIDKKITPIQALIEKAKRIPKLSGSFCELDARNLLGKFSLTGKQQLQTIGTLSGGQKSRVVLALESLSEPPLLVLDEPTNHLDLESIEALSKAINEFQGAVVVVSHDIHFIEKCCCDLWIMKKKTKKVARGLRGNNRENAKAVKGAAETGPEALSELEVIPNCDDFFREFRNYLQTQNIND